MRSTIPTLLTSTVLCATSALSVLGCAADPSCHRTTDAQGQTVVTCPRLDPITLEDTPAPGPCVRQRERLICGQDDVYTLEGERAPTEAAQEQTPEDGENGENGEGGEGGEGDENPLDPGMNEDPEDPETGGLGAFGEAGQGTPSSSSCQILGAQVLCRDGLQAPLPFETGQEEARCRSELIAGLGRRLICVSGEQTAVVRPEQGGDPAQVDPTCEASATEITCTEGTIYQPEPGSPEADALARVVAEGECARPRMPELGDSEIDELLACLEQVDCSQVDPTDDQAQTMCFEKATAGRSARCEALMNPALVCEDEQGRITQTFEPAQACQGPNTGWELRLGAVRQHIRQQDCERLRGDVWLRPRVDEQGEVVGPRANLIWLEALADVRNIRGGLFVQHAFLPAGDTMTDRWASLDEVWKLAVVNGPMRWEHLEVGYLPLTSEDLYTRQLRFSHLEGVTQLQILRKLRLAQAVYITSNPDLEVVDLADTDIRGTFAFTGNPAFDTCKLDRLIRWAARHADAVLVAAGSAGGSRCDD